MDGLPLRPPCMQTAQRSASPNCFSRETVLQCVTAAGAGVVGYTATYDAVGNRLTVQELDGTRVTHGYGASYQLVNVQRSGANAVLRPVARNRAVVGSVASASAARERHTRPGRQTWTGGCRREGAHGQV